MRRIAIFWVLLALLLTGNPAQAQGGYKCLGAGDLTLNVQHGLLVDDHYEGVNYSNGGTPYKLISISTLVPDMRVTAVDVDWMYVGTLDEFPASLLIELRDEPIPVAQYETNETVPFTYFKNVQAVFSNGETAQNVNKIYFEVSHQATTAPGNQVALKINGVCGYSTAFVTNTPVYVFQTNTPTRTNTSSPTNTPTAAPPSSTPTSTNTPTPGGPTDTPTNTPTSGGGGGGPDATNTAYASTQTAVYQATVTSVAAIPSFPPGDWKTPRPPAGCDPQYEACQDLPFQPPDFATLDLPSPTAIDTRVAELSTPTPLATAAEGTGTPAGAVVVLSFATQIGGLAENILTITPQFNDISGESIDLRNAANEIGSNAGAFFGFLRALRNLFLGRAGTIIAFLFLILTFVLLVRGVVLFQSIAQSVVRWLERIKSLIWPV